MMCTARYARKRCSVEVCEIDTGTAGISLHRFPLDFRRREAWVRFCNNRSLQGKTPWQLRDRIVCSLHFEESAFLRPGHLRHNALRGVRQPHRAARTPAAQTRGVPDHQSSEINLSWNEVDHSYALRHGAAPAQESSGDVAAMKILVSSPSPRDYLSGCAAEPPYKSPGKSGSIDKKEVNTLRTKVRQLQERNKRLKRRLQRQRQMRTVAEVVESAAFMCLLLSLHSLKPSIE